MTLTPDSLHQPAVRQNQLQLPHSFDRSHAWRRVVRRYRHIRSDVEPIIQLLQAGNICGDQILHIGYTLFKVHVRNSDSQKGKRGGYRLIYYLRTTEIVILVTIYSKSDQGDIAAEQVQRILAEAELTD